MKSVLILFNSVINFYIWILIINAVLSWLVAFKVLNVENRLVYSVVEFSYRITAPPLNDINIITLFFEEFSFRIFWLLFIINKPHNIN